MSHASASITRAGAARPVYILGGGAVGLTLAAYLTAAGRPVTLVRTRQGQGLLKPGLASVSIDHGRDPDPVLHVDVPMISLQSWQQQKTDTADAIAVITTKSYANDALASALRQRGFTGSMVIMQNGVNVEAPFIEAGFAEVHRCVLYVTSQTAGDLAVKFRPIASCGIGVMHGSEADRDACVAAVNLPEYDFHFHAEANIQRLIWKKAILNAVFNSICPLLDVDNGIFMRDAGAAALAQEIVEECLTLTQRLGISPAFTLQEIMQQLMKISQGGNGVLISTFQDIRHGRQTEIESLNLAMAKIAAKLQPPLQLIKTEMLGRMIFMKGKGE